MSEFRFNHIHTFLSLVELFRIWRKKYLVIVNCDECSEAIPECCKEWRMKSKSLLSKGNSYLDIYLQFHSLLTKQNCSKRVFLNWKWNIFQKHSTPVLFKTNSNYCDFKFFCFSKHTALNVNGFYKKNDPDCILKMKSSCKKSLN